MAHTFEALLGRLDDATRVLNYPQHGSVSSLGKKDLLEEQAKNRRLAEARCNGSVGGVRAIPFPPRSLEMDGVGTELTEVQHVAMQLRRGQKAGKEAGLARADSGKDQTSMAAVRGFT